LTVYLGIILHMGTPRVLVYTPNNGMAYPLTARVRTMSTMVYI